MLHPMLLVAVCQCAFAQSPNTAIIPQPVRVNPLDGVHVLTPETCIVADMACADLAEQLRGYLRPATGLPLTITPNEADNAIILRIDPRIGKPTAAPDDAVRDETACAEAYRLVVSPKRIEITGASPAGVFCGIQTLRQLLPAKIFRHAVVKNVRWEVPCVEIDDAPRFSWRGAHMDVARHFMPREFVLKFLDLMALHKLNVFHWHLVDGTGWRIEIKKYPRLTECASRSDYSSMWPENATHSVNQAPGGYYTQEDIREIVEYAKARFITIVPEIELPGHSLAAIRAYPQFGNVEQVLEAGGDITGLDAWNADVYNVDDATIAYLKDVLSEVMALFPGRFIHIGGDEVSKEPWKRNPRAQARMKSLGLDSEEELQSWFVRQFDDFLIARGRRLIGWDEILEGGLADNAAVMAWRGMDGGIAAARAGHDVVMAPTSHTYFDYCQARPRECEPRAFGGYLPLRIAYGFEPVPTELSKTEARHILGAQFQLWSEFIPHPKHMEYMAYPRGCALAEVVWSPKELRDYDGFLRRLRAHAKRLDALDVNYRPLDRPDFHPVAQWKPEQIGEPTVVMEWDITDAVKQWHAADAPEARVSSHVDKDSDAADAPSEPGDYRVIFSQTGGANRLTVEWIEVLADETMLARSPRPADTKDESRQNQFTVTIKSIEPGKQYLLRAGLRCDGGTDSMGEVYVVPEAAF